jgi:hypothetical protein
MATKNIKHKEREHIDIVKKAIEMAGNGTMVTIEFERENKEGSKKNAGKRI